MRFTFYFTALFSFSIASVFAQSPTWSNDIAKIVYARCTPCHHTGGLAPSSLMTYQEVYARRFQIEYAVTNRIMPPWPADPNYKEHAHQNVLSNAEIAAIQQWVANDAPVGDVKVAPAQPFYNPASKLGTPDLTMQMQAFTVPNNGDVYRNFVLPSHNLSQTRYATAIEVIPGNKAIVHHVLVFVDTSNTAVNPNSPGAIATASSKLIYGYVPGAEPYFAPPGTGYKITPSTRIIIQMHYAPGSLGQIDDTKVNFKLTSTPQREILGNFALNHLTAMVNGPLSIPANTTRTFFQQSNVPVGVTLLYGWPHMHLIGRSIRSYATTAANDTIRFFDVPKWNFHWQMNYIFPRTVRVPASSKLHATAFYDNTASNPFNPSSPPKNVSSGEGTEDEMMGVYFAFLPYQNGDENLIVDNRILPRSGTTICTGQPVLLETIEGPGYTYQWRKNGTPISGATSYAFTATSGGSYTVSISLGGNNSVSEAVVVTENPLPTVSLTPAASTAICSGESVAIQATTGSGFNYTWFRNDTLIQGATSATFNATQAGSYKVEVFNGCYGNSTPVEVTLHSQPSTPEITQNDNTLTATPAAGYEWFKDGVSTDVTTQQFTATESGCYTVGIADANGCVAISNQVCLTISNLAFNALASVKFFPNPVNDYLMVDLGETQVDGFLVCKDIAGKVVMRTRIEQQWQQLDMSALSNGMYFVAVADKEMRALVTKRVVKQGF